MEKKRRENTNSGFSLFSVILAVSFVAILVLALMYLSLVNFRMRQTELKTKNSFYSAEQALEEIRTGLQQMEGDALGNAYVRVLEAYAVTNVSNAVEERSTRFKELFLRNLVNALVDPSKDTHSITFNYYDINVLKSFVSMDKLQPGESLLIEPVPAEQVLTGSMDNGVLLRGIQVTFVDAGGKTSIIRTDIRMGVPNVNFIQSSDLPDLLNMSLVAEGGVSVLGKSTLKGNLYAGSSPDKAPGSKYGIYVRSNGELDLSGDRIVTNGTVYADTMSKIICQPKSSLWARNILVKSSQVSLLGKTYVNDDLTIETTVGNTNAGGDEAYIGSNSVTLSGEYYGYGNASTAAGGQASAQLTDLYGKLPNADKESAILVNGKNTTIDLSGLKHLMLAGNSYIYSDPTPTGTTGFGDLAMGESLTVKNNQLAYLVPPQCLFTGEDGYSNPMSFATYQSGMNSIGTPGSTTIKEFNLDIPIAKLGGKTLKEMGVTDVNKLFVQQTSMVYYYMSFQNTQSAAAYFRQYYNNPLLKEQVDAYAAFYLDKNSGIKMGSPDAFLRFVTKGNTFSYAGGQGTVSEPKYDDQSQALLQEQKNNQDIFYALNKKMINNYAALEVTTDGRDEADKDTYVYSNMVNLAEMKKFIQDNSNNGIYEFKNSTLPNRAIIVDNQSTEYGGANKEFIVDASMGSSAANPVSVIICNGPVVVKQDVKFRGVILTNGTITLESGADIVSDMEKVAKTLQNNRDKNGASTPLIGEQNVSPMYFLWDSSQYLLSGVAGGGNPEDMKDAFNLSKLVMYENWEKN